MFFYVIALALLAVVVLTASSSCDRDLTRTKIDLAESEIAKLETMYPGLKNQRHDANHRAGESN